MKRVRSIQISTSIDRELEKLLPPHFHGERKLRMRVEHVVSLWIDTQKRLRGADVSSAARRTGS